MTFADLLATPSFWTGPVTWASVASLCAVLLGGLIRWRGNLRRVRTVWRESGGAAVTIDFLLIVPVGLLVISLLVQALVLAHQSLIVHAAAFSAARSTLAYGCPPTLRAAMTEAVGLDRLSGCDDTQTAGRALLASQTVLVAAAASSGFARSRGACPDLRETVLGQGLPVLLEGGGVRPGLREAIDNKICYVLEGTGGRAGDSNVRVETTWQSTPPSAALKAKLATALASVRNRDFFGDDDDDDDGQTDLLGGLMPTLQKRPPVRATVRFRYPITAPVGMLLADGRRADGTRWRMGHATVVVR